MGDWLDWLAGEDTHHRRDNEAGQSKRVRKMHEKARREKAARLKKAKAEQKGRTTQGSDGTWYSW